MKVTPGKLETRLILPSQLGRHALATLYIEYANTGETPISAPIIQLASADPDDSDKPLLTLEKDRLSSGFWTSSLPQGFAHSVSFLASGTQPGVINPGETIRVPVYYAGLQQPWDFSDNQVELATTILSGSDTRPMNWEGMSYVTATSGREWTIADNATNAMVMRAMESRGGGSGLAPSPPPRLFVIPWANGAPLTSEQLEQRYRIGGITKREEVPGVLQMRPDTVTPDAWSAIVTNMRASVGETLGDYVRTIAQDAVYLSRQGIASNNINDLWSFEILKNSASLGPGTVLASSTDAAMATPGMSLALSRRFDNTIAGRYAAGRFGQGWVSTWDAVIKTAADGSVTIGSNGGGGVRYEPDSRTEGGYFSMLGDTSTLRKVAGVFALTATDGTVTRFDTQGRVASVTDRLGNAVTAGYDSQSRLIKLTHSCGSTLSLAYNTADRVASVTDSAGRVTTYAYDPTNAYLLSVTDSDGLATAYTYQTDGIAAQQHAMTSISAANVTRSFSYDPQGRLTATYLGKDIDRVTYTYDSGTVAVSDSAGKTTLFYDAAGRLVKVVDPLGDLSRSIYDSLGRLTASVAATGDTQTFSWDKSNRLTALTDELGFTTTFSYGGPFGQLGSLKDARGNAIRYTRDPQGNLLTTTYADGSSETLAGYTVAGLAGTFTNRRGQATSLTYTATGQVDVETLAGGSKVDFDYDARGNLDRLTEISPLGDNKVTDYQYDYATSGDRLTRVVYPDGRFVAYAYDAFGRRSSTTDSTGAVTTYSYDTAGRLWKVADAGGGMLAEYAYDVSGRLSQVTKGNGTFTMYGYDAAGQLIHLVNYAPGGSGSTGVNSRFDYTYDSKGRRTAMHTLDGDWTYGYDATNQLTTAVFTSANLAIASQDLRYDYDAVGNRTRTTINGVVTEYVTNAMNQYTSVGGTAFTHDADGNLTSDGTHTYAYDARNKLVRVSGPEGVTEYEYDALGNRTASVTDGVRVEYLNDPQSLAGAVAEFSADGTVRQQVVHGLGLIGTRGGAWGTSYFDFDALGSVVGATGSGGAVQRSTAYDPFGGTLLNVGSGTDAFGFVGQFGVRSAVGQPLFMNARYYDAVVGRFLSQDPLGLRAGDVNPFRYVMNAPLGSVDPSGLCAEDGDSSSTGDKLLNKALGVLKKVGEKQKMQGANVKVFRGAWQSGETGSQLAELVGELLWGDSRAPGGGSGGQGCDTPPDDPQDPSPPDGAPPALPPSGPAGGAGTAGSVDPNEKLSVNGFGVERAIRGDTTIPYRINFENIGPGSIDPHTNQKYTTFATAPAQRVTVVDQLSSTLDWSTFRLAEMGFGDTIVTIPANSTSYEGVVSISYGGTSFVVELSAGISLATGRVSAAFQSIDPQTNLPPDVLVGFLPPEDGNGIGKGFFSFTIRPRADLPTGTVLKNVALISFDGQGIIATNQSNPFDPQSADPNDPTLNALNTIDNTLPVAPPFSIDPSAPLGTVAVSALEMGAAWMWSLDGGATWAIGVGNTFVLPIGTYAPGGVLVRQIDGVGWQGPAAANSILIEVVPPNHAPTEIVDSSDTVSECESINTVVGILSTADPDADDTFTYELVAGDGSSDNSFFTLTSDELRTAVTFDYEIKQSYSLRVRTTDQGGLSFERPFIISVLDVNEAPTDIWLSNATILENSPGFAVVGTLSAADPDAADSLVFALIAGAGSADNSLFVVQGNALTTARSFDFETKQSYSVRVRTTDQGGLSFEKPFTIAVVDLNEAPADIVLSKAAIPENSPAFTAVGILSAVDPDTAEPLSFAIVPGAGSADNASFVLEGNVLRTARSFDFESRQSYTVRVRATDQLGLSFEKPLTIDITNVNEMPSSIRMGSIAIAEHAGSRATVGTLTTDDIDAGDIFTYTLVSGDGSADNDAFKIEGDQLKAVSDLDFEIRSSYSVRIRSVDSGGLLTERPFTISVIDVNEAPVAIRLSNAVIPENCPAHTVVGTLSAVDPDSADTLTFALAEGMDSADSAAFVIEGNVLRTARSFNYETKQSYTVRVRTTDQGGLSFEMPFTIEIADVVIEPLGVEAVVPPVAGAYRSGDLIRFTVIATKNVVVTGSPELPITIGKTKTKAIYTSGSGTNQLVFTYKTGLRDNAVGITVGDKLTLPKKTIIRDLSSTNMPLSLPAASTGGIVLDTITPKSVGTAIVAPASGTLFTGDSVTIRVKFSEPTILNGVPEIRLTVGKAARVAEYVSGSGTDLLEFRYTVLAADRAAKGFTIDPRIVLPAGTAIADAAGNPASLGFKAPKTASYKVNPIPPATLGVALANDTGLSDSDFITKVGTLKITGKEDGATIQYSKDGGNSWNAQFTPLQGKNSVLVRQVDVADNASAPTAITFTLDTIAPALPLVSLLVDSGSSSNDRITNNPALKLSVDNNALVEYSTDNGSTWKASFAAVAGVNSVKLRKTDPAGNTVVTPTGFAFTFDNQAPARPSLSLASNTGIDPGTPVPVTNVITLKITGAEAGATMQYSQNGNAWLTSYSAVQGSNNVRGRQVDTAGNASTAAELAFIYDSVKPTLQSVIVPSAGTYGIGNVLRISVTFSEQVFLGPTKETTAFPFIPLTLGTVVRKAIYESGSGSATLFFAYTIIAGDKAPSGIAVASAISLVPGTWIEDAAGNSILLTLSATLPTPLPKIIITS